MSKGTLIEVRCVNGTKSVAAAATSRLLAVHRLVNQYGEPSWTVTHRPTGLSVWHFSDKAKAIKFFRVCVRASRLFDVMTQAEFLKRITRTPYKAIADHVKAKAKEFGGYQ